MSFAQPRTIRTISAVAWGVPSAKLVGSTLLRNPSMCCSMTQLSVNSAIGRSLRGHGCGKCCAGSGFFGPQSSGAIVAALHCFAVWCGTTACVHVPTHSRNAAGPPSERPVAALSAFRRPLDPFGRQHHTSRRALDQFCWWGGERGENFVAVLLPWPRGENYIINSVIGPILSCNS